MGVNRQFSRKIFTQARSSLKKTCEDRHQLVAHNGICPVCAMRNEAIQIITDWHHRWDMEAMTKRALQWKVIDGKA